MKVTYLSHHGDDLLVVNSARVSLGKHKQEMDESDVRLLRHLASHRPIHWSPFSHPQLTVRVEAPIFVARQLLRHQVGLAVNEVSRRYVDHSPEFYRPKQWRRRPDHGIKQGSGSAMSASEQSTLADIYDDLLIELQSAYKLMIGLGVAPEQARMLLPQSMYTSWYWTGSLYAFHRVVAHRLPSDAQFETREIAEQLHDILRDCFPQAYGALYQYAGDGC